METKAHYALVGFFTIALIAAGALFAVWLGQLRFDRAYKEFDVVFQGPVRGLTESSEVRFNGIKVGEVTRLGLDAQDPSMVVARIRIAEETPVTRDSFGQLEPQGLTGVNYIQLNPGSPDSDPLISRPGEVPRLASRQAALESLLASSEDIAQSASEALVRFNALMSERNLEELAEILVNVRTITAALSDESENGVIPLARTALGDVDTAAKELAEFAEEANRLLENEVAVMVKETTDASIEVERASAEAYAIMEQAREPIDRFMSEGLDDLTLAVADLRRLLIELEAIAAGVEDNPAAFVAGARREEVEIPR